MVSQNAEQRNSTTINNEAAPSNRYSYTLYDGLSRITTVGELHGNSLVSVPNNSFVQETDLSMFMSGTTKKSITRTFYDSELSISSHISYTTLTGKLHHLRKRVVATTFQEDENSAIQQASYYSYDLMGNVKSIWQQVYGLQDLKQISYQYELSSGKTTGVLYQDGKADAFYHQYEYDGENRLKAVYTNTQKSTDANLLSIVNIPGTKKDASYQYYLHGPLSRTELGGNLQGLDYSYTLQGWLKSLNGQDLNPLREMGRDGESGSGLHSGFSRDVLVYSLGYFIGDYQPINNSNVIRTYTHFGVNGLRGKPVFNGNISFTTVANKGLGDESTLNAYIYAYYQNGNLSGRSLKVIPAGTNSWNDNIGSTPKYYETLAYDLNGNIISHIRAGNLPADSYKMDELLYDYTYNSNKLDRVRENYLNAGAYTNDIEGQSVGNYTYDKIGNLISDVQEGITGIFWNVYGKIREIRKGATVIKYRYDAAGNRVYKEEVGPGVNTATWYVRDAQGNTLATYEGVATPTIKESYIYRSSRLGSYSWNIGVGTPARTYEISNYLGNVMATIGDGQIPRMNGSLIEYYDADIKTATDYYSFGMVMPGRSFNSGIYRYGFNGQEMSNEIKGVGNSYTAEFWEYDPRLGRRWNMDPIYKYDASPYVVLGNSPIMYIDPRGNDWYKNSKGQTFWQKGDSKTVEYDGETWNNIGAINYSKEMVGGKEYNAVYNQDKLVHFSENTLAANSINQVTIDDLRSDQRNRYIQDWMNLDHANGQVDFPRPAFLDFLFGSRTLGSSAVIKGKQYSSSSIIDANGYITDRMMPTTGIAPSPTFRGGLSGLVKVDVVASDWATKGAHLKVFDGFKKPLEVALKPGNNGTIVIKSVFSSQNASRIYNAEKRIKVLLEDPSFRKAVMENSIKARDMFRSGTDIERAASGELHFLIKAIEKLNK